ncbi:MAG: DNA recombination protein RmuC, partial [Maribacter dokdonensis]
MNEIYIYLIIAILCLAIGYFLGNYIQLLKTKSRQSTLEEREQQMLNNLSVFQDRLKESENQKFKLQTDKEQLGNQIVRYQADLDNLRLKN